MEEINMLITGIGNSFTTRTAFGKENSCNNRQPLTDNKAEDSCVFLNQVSETKSEKTKPAIQAFPTEDSKSIYLLVEDYNQTSIEEIKDKINELKKENNQIKYFLLRVIGVPPSTGELIDEQTSDIPELIDISTRDSIDSLEKSIYKSLGWKRQPTDSKAEDSCVSSNQVSETKSEKTKPAIQVFPTEDGKSIYLLVEDYNQTSIEEIKDKMKEITKENKDIKDITLTVVGVPPSTGELIDEEITDVPELSSIMTRDSIDSLDKSIYKMLGWKRQNTKFD